MNEYGLTPEEQETFERVMEVGLHEMCKRAMSDLYGHYGFSQRKLAKLADCTVYQVRKMVGAPV